MAKGKPKAAFIEIFRPFVGTFYSSSFTLFIFLFVIRGNEKQIKREQVSPQREREL